MPLVTEGSLCRHCRQPGVKAGRTGLVCHRCYIKLLNIGYRRGGKPMGPAPKK